MMATGCPPGTRSSSTVKSRPRTGSNAHHLKVVAGDECAERAFGLTIHGDAHRRVVLRHEVDERRPIAEVAIVGIRPRAIAAFAALHVDNVERVRVVRTGDRMQQDRLHPREDCRVRADPQPQRQNDGDGERGRLDERPDGVAKVLEERHHRGQSPGEAPPRAAKNGDPLLRFARAASCPAPPWRTSSMAHRKRAPFATTQAIKDVAPRHEAVCGLLLDEPSARFVHGTRVSRNCPLRAMNVSSQTWPPSKTCTSGAVPAARSTARSAAALGSVYQ